MLRRHVAGPQVPGPDANLARLDEEWHEERQAADMVKVRVGKEQIGIDGSVLHHLVAEIAQARAGIEQQHVLAATYFER